VKKSVIIGLLAGLVLLGWASGLLGQINLETVRQTVEHAGAFGPLLFILLFGLEGIGVPGIVFMLTAVAIWPPELAFFYNWIGAQFAGLVGFGYARWIGRDWVEKHLPDRFRKYQARLTENGLTAVILVRLIFFIVPPAHWLLGLSSISLRTYLLGTAVGLLPGMFLISYGGGHALEWLLGQSKVALSIIVVVGLVALGVTWFLRRTRKRGEAEGISNASSSHAISGTSQVMTQAPNSTVNPHKIITEHRSPPVDQQIGDDQYSKQMKPGKEVS